MNTAEWFQSDGNKRWSFVNSGSSEVSAIIGAFNAHNRIGALNVISSPVSSRTHNLTDRKTVLIQDLGDERLSLQSSLPVIIECREKQTTAYSYDLNEFAFAAEEIDAVDQFKVLVVDLYFLLKEEQNNLGPLPLKHWNFLRSIIREN